MVTIEVVGHLAAIAYWLFVTVTKCRGFHQLPLNGGIRWRWLHGTTPGTDGYMVAT